MLVAASLVYERSRISQEQHQRLSTKAKVIDENINRQLEGVANALASVAQDFDELNGSPRWMERRLIALTDAMPGVRTLNVLDNTGHIVASNRENLIGLDLSGREYFQTAVRLADPNRLYLSEPFETVLGVYSINLVKVMVQPDGTVSHVISATLDPTFFQVLLSSVLFAPDVWVALAHQNGLLVLHYPERPELLGLNLNQPGSFFSRHMASGQPASFLTGIVKTTGAEGWMAQRTIDMSDLGIQGTLVVAVARSPRKALEQWTVLLAIGIATVVLASLVFSLGLLALHRMQDRARTVLAQEEYLRQKAEEEIRHMAFYDALTKLPNRRMLYDRLEQMLAASVRRGRYSALLFLDLDGFKQINDQFGHDKGDLLLQEVARRLQAETRQEDTTARLAGDEFVIMLAELHKSADEASRLAARVVEKVLAALAQPFDLDGTRFNCTASVGVTLFGAKDEPLDDILKRADQAMYQAKASGRNTYRSMA